MEFGRRAHGRTIPFLIVIAVLLAGCANADAPNAVGAKQQRQRPSRAPVVLGAYMVSTPQLTGAYQAALSRQSDFLRLAYAAATTTSDNGERLNRIATEYLLQAKAEIAFNRYLTRQHLKVLTGPSRVVWTRIDGYTGSQLSAQQCVDFASARYQGNTAAIRGLSPTPAGPHIQEITFSLGGSPKRWLIGISNVDIGSTCSSTPPSPGSV